MLMLSSLKKSYLPFTLSFLVLLIFPAIIPQIRLLALVPLLTFVCFHYSLAAALWISMFAGLLVDLYSKSAPMGFFALNYTLTSIIVFRYRSYFTFEKVHIFSLYAVLYSFISTLLHFILYGLIEMHFKLHFFSIITDLILMPIFDGVYSLVCVFFPMKIYETVNRPKNIRKMRKRLILIQQRLLLGLYKLKK